MRKFKITVDGKSYNVEVEELGGVASVAAPVVASAPVAVQPVAKPVEKAIEKPVEASKPAAPVSGNGTPVSCPMPGVIVDVKAASGSTVKNGDTIVILEAMKMEIAIKANKDGVVTVVATKGATVNTGDVLAYIA